MVLLKIAGTKFYHTECPPAGTKLVLKSNPDNQYDSNAIEVRDDEGDQLGHVPAAAAALMTLLAQEIGHPVEEIFEAKMEYDENFTLAVLPGAFSEVS
jgi:hypothetical protein